MTRWAVVLAGGVGTRFWPLSTQERPKQLLPLIAKEPLLVEQLRRLRPIAPPAHTLVLTNSWLVKTIRRVAPGVPSDNIIAEPKPAGTAAALAWAAHVIEQRDTSDATMISVHADWSIADADGFREVLTTAASAAELHHSLVTVGVIPTRPDTGFGYIEPGQHRTGMRLRKCAIVDTSGTPASLRGALASFSRKSACTHPTSDARSRNTPIP